MTRMKINESAPVIAAHEVLVRAGPEVVWSIIVAVDHWPDWNPDVRATFIEGDLAAGTDFRWKAGPGTIRSRVLEIREPHHLVWSGTTLGIKAVHLWQIERRGEETLVRSEESWEGLLPGILRGTMKRMLSRSLQQGLVYLKKEAERRSNDAIP